MWYFDRVSSKDVKLFIFVIRYERADVYAWTNIFFLMSNSSVYHLMHTLLQSLYLIDGYLIYPAYCKALKPSTGAWQIFTNLPLYSSIVFHAKRKQEIDLQRKLKDITIENFDYSFFILLFFFSCHVLKNYFLLSY